jgi:4-hydroxy-tetrahydrodipicolinate synthase
MKMKKTIFRGVGTALITPFREGKIDYQALEKIIELQISAEIDALIVGGTTAEIATLSDDERYHLYAFCKEKCANRAKIIFGTGTNDTSAAIRHTKMAEKIGCDGVLLVTPYYNKGTEEGVFRHYSEILSSTALPAILYNVPSRTGVNLGLGLLSRLMENEKVVGIKEASDSADRLVALSACGSKLPLYAGNDSQIYTCLSLGGEGVISVISNLLPRETVEITRLFDEGKREEALKRQQRLLPLINALFLETNPAPIKWAMQEVGLCSGELRLPLYLPRESTVKALQEELLKLGLI